MFLYRNSSLATDNDVLSTEVKVVLGILTFGGSFVGIFGNFLVMLAIACTPAMRQRVADLLVFNLALTDILVACIPLPILGSYFVFYWPDWKYGNTACQGTAYVVNVCSLVSVLTLVVIAIDRFFAVVKNRHILRRRVLGFTLAGMWFISALALIYPLLSGGVEHEFVGDGVYRVCNKMTGHIMTSGSFKRSAILKLIIGVAVQVALLILYARMGYTLWIWRRFPTAEGNDAKSVKQNRQIKMRAFRTMLAIVLAFGICWTPYWVTTFLRLRTFNDVSDNISSAAVLITYAIAMLNSAVNPVLYALLSKKYRRAYVRVLSGCKTSLPIRYLTSRRTRKSSVYATNNTTTTM